MRMAARLEAMRTEKYIGLTRRSGGRAVWTGHLRLDRASLDAPLSWRKPRMVFVNSMSDLFHDAVPAAYIAEVWRVMEQAHQHTFQILTKRPLKMAEVVAGLPKLANVWLGTTVESGEFIQRLDLLRQINAAVRFVSFEPLLSSVAKANLKNIDWAIVGGESGPKARPMEKAWVKEIHQLCRRSGTAFFFKQWGGKQKARTGRMLDGRTWDEFPTTSDLVAV